MSHTYATNLLHCVFSTKNRADLIPADCQEKLWAYLHGVAKADNIELPAAGGTANHLHLLIALPPVCPLSKAGQKLKGNSSRWLRKDFEWQQGYGAFSVSPSQVAAVKR